MLTEKLAWARPVNSRLFQESCTQGGRCNPLQAVCKASSLTRMRFSLAIGPAYLPHPGPLELDGSVLFAEDPSEFEDRLCSIASEDQNIGQLNWNTLLGWICLPLFTMILWVVLNLRSIVIFVFLKGFNSVKLLD